MSDSDLYSRLLFPKKQGYPLFHPQPFDDLPEPARRTGTEIGDVGLITQDGSFDPLFNILHAREDPSNRFGVPPAFEQLPLGPDDIATRALFHLPGSDISNTTINKRRVDVDAGIEDNVFLPFGAGAVVEVSTNSKQTGLLLLPEGASRWDLRPQQVFRDYALRHAHNWYAFVNGSLHRMIGNGDLYLVTGVTKSTSWSVAAVENHSSEGKISLKLKAAQIGNAGGGCAWEWESASSSVDSGPRRHPGEEFWRDNQTVFLRGFKVALRSTPLRRAPKIRSVVNSKWTDMSSKGKFIPFSQAQSPAASPSIPPSQPQSSRQPSDQNMDCLSPGIGNTSDESLSSSETLSSSEALISSSNCYHPSALINEHLLDCAVGATVAVTHDDEWASVLSENESEVPDDQELLKRISDNFQMSIVHGGVCLQNLDVGMESLSMLADQEASQETLSHIQSIDAFNEVVEVERDASTSGTPSAVRSETAASSFLDVPSPSSYSVKRGIIIPTPTPSIGLFHRLTSPFRRANATADSNSPSMQPLTRQETHSSTLSWWSDKNPGLQPPSINLHAVAKPLMKLLYHRQAMAFIKRNHTSPLSSEIMATYSRYLRWTSVSSFTKAAILSELSNTCASPEDARTVVDSLRFWYLVEMLDSPAPRVRSSACRLLGSLASHGCTAPDIAELCRRLQSLLGDKDTKVVLGANYALSQIPRDKQDF